jgi:hypothetical protein
MARMGRIISWNSRKPPGTSELNADVITVLGSLKQVARARPCIRSNWRE